MMISTTQMTTAHASKYLQQLAKHFGHKVPVTFTPTIGQVTLPFGSCEMNATPDTLSLSVEGGKRDLSQLEQFIEDHLVRFVFRENPTLSWRRKV